MLINSEHKTKGKFLFCCQFLRVQWLVYRIRVVVMCTSLLYQISYFPNKLPSCKFFLNIKFCICALFVYAFVSIWLFRKSVIFLWFPWMCEFSKFTVNNTNIHAKKKKYPLICYFGYKRNYGSLKRAIHEIITMINSCVSKMSSQSNMCSNVTSIFSTIPLNNIVWHYIEA